MSLSRVYHVLWRACKSFQWFQVVATFATPASSNLSSSYKCLVHAAACHVLKKHSCDKLPLRTWWPKETTYENILYTPLIYIKAFFSQMNTVITAWQGISWQRQWCMCEVLYSTCSGYLKRKLCGIFYSMYTVKQPITNFTIVFWDNDYQPLKERITSDYLQ